MFICMPHMAIKIVTKDLRHNESHTQHRSQVIFFCSTAEQVNILTDFFLNPDGLKEFSADIRISRLLDVFNQVCNQ